MKWIAIVLGILIALISINYFLCIFLPRRRIARFLKTRRVEFSAIKISSSYGWPVYRIIFENGNKAIEFGQSPEFKALLNEIQLKDGKVKHGEQQFDARMAVSIEAFK